MNNIIIFYGQIYYLCLFLYSKAVVPVSLLKIFIKCKMSEKPHESATAVTDKSVVSNNSQAYITRFFYNIVYKRQTVFFLEKS